VALVTGATGVIGPALVDRLRSAGYRVRVLIRHSPSPNLIAPTVEIAPGDVTDAGAVRTAAIGVDVAFHLAAKLHISNPAPQLAAEYRRVNVEGTRILVDACVEAGVERLIFFSSIAVYGATQAGQVVDESSPTKPDTLYAATKAEAEAIVLAARRADGSPLGVVLRVAATYGPRVKGNYRQLVYWLQRGWFVPVGRGENRRTLVHYNDVVGAAMLAAEHPLSVGRIFNVTDGSIHTFREIVGEISRALQRGAPRWYIPEGVARFAARTADVVLKSLGRRTMVEPMLVKLTEDMAVDGQRIGHELGFRAKYDLRTGWAETVTSLFEKR
jgi:nucleoside-diphosphate-sugar epimerase